MLYSRPGRFWIVTWCVAAPVFLGVRMKERDDRCLSSLSGYHSLRVGSTRQSELRQILGSVLLRGLLETGGNRRSPCALLVSWLESHSWLDVRSLFGHLHSGCGYLSTSHRERKSSYGRRWRGVRSAKSRYSFLLAISPGHYPVERSTTEHQSGHCH